jgi:hypothetical protein
MDLRLTSTKNRSLNGGVNPTVLTGQGYTENLRKRVMKEVVDPFTDFSARWMKMSATTSVIKLRLGTKVHQVIRRSLTGLNTKLLLVADTGKSIVFR